MNINLENPRRLTGKKKKKLTETNKKFQSG